MKKLHMARFIYVVILLFGMLSAAPVFSSDAVNVILKNAASSSVDLELVDQYGGNYTTSLEAETSQNHTLKTNSAVKIGGNTIHIVVPEDEGKEVIVAKP